MHKARACLLTILMILCFSFTAHSQQGQQIFSAPADSGDLITPVNVKPLSIDAVSRRRGIVTSEPARNLIVFSCSGFSGASAAFLEKFSRRRRDPAQWQGFQLVFPPWVSGVSPEDVNIVRSLTEQGKRVGLISDVDFMAPPFVYGYSKPQTARLEDFHLALTFSSEKSKDKRAEAFLAPALAGMPVAYDFAGLEEFFRNKTNRFFGSFYSSANSLPMMKKREEPWMPELVSSLVGRMALYPEGFCLIINYSGVSEARKNMQFCRMLEHMKVQESILQQLSAFVNGRKDTLLLVVDEPENGMWQVKSTFSLESFVDDLSKINEAADFCLKAVEDRKGTLAEIINVEIAKEELEKAVAKGDRAAIFTMLEEAVNQKHEISFVSSGDSGFNAGLTVLAQGCNADVFFGIGSFSQFFSRIKAAFGNN